MEQKTRKGELRMDKNATIQLISEGNTVLGIEFGSTRIKAVLLSNKHEVIATGGHTWENQLVNGVWTYYLDDAWHGMQQAYRELSSRILSEYGIPIKTLGAIGISGMMHGYLPFDALGEQLAIFATWRNTNTMVASEELTQLFNFNIPLRWSISHLYHAILSDEPHVSQIAYITTLAGYIHWKLTDKKVLGIGEASGMFPIDSDINSYNREMICKFQKSINARKFPWKVSDILPQVLIAGDCAGHLTQKGALLLDPTGNLVSGIPFAAPEGDAGTGMVATNSVSVRSGNISGGTSIFSMIVLDHTLDSLHAEIDMVTTPNGNPVAMIHCNNCTSDINSWVGIFEEFVSAMNASIDVDEIYRTLFTESLRGDTDCGGVMVVNYFSGEHITGLPKGLPFVIRKPDSNFTLANFIRAHLYSCMATLVIGMKIIHDEGIQIDRLNAHGGLFKHPGIAQRFLAAATRAPVAVTKSAGEGGPYGMALLAAYMKYHKEGEPLEEYINQVFSDFETNIIRPDPNDSLGFDKYLSVYRQALSVERYSVEKMWGQNETAKN